MRFDIICYNNCKYHTNLDSDIRRRRTLVHQHSFGFLIKYRNNTPYLKSIPNGFINYSSIITVFKKYSLLRRPAYYYVGFFSQKYIAKIWECQIRVKYLNKSFITTAKPEVKSVKVAFLPAQNEIREKKK